MTKGSSSYLMKAAFQVVCVAAVCLGLYASNFFSYLHNITAVFDNPVLLSGGMAGGVLHALTGPDHLLSILPHILGQRYWKGFRVGSVWGVGHGLTTCFIGGIAYVLKGSFVDFEFLDILVNVNSFAIGITLIVIGLMGLYESGHYHKTHMKDENGNQMIKSDVVYLAIFLNGLFLGFSWDGLPSLAPTLTTTSFETVFAFLAGNFFGTMLSIGIFSGIIAEGSSFLSRMSNEALVSRMCAASSLTATGMGSFTIITAIYKNPYFSFSASVALISLILCIVVAVVVYIGKITGGFDYITFRNWCCVAKNNLWRSSDRKNGAISCSQDVFKFDGNDRRMIV
jgi:nickel/cobalt exporter